MKVDGKGVDLSRVRKKILHFHKSRLVDPGGPIYYFGGRHPHP